MKVVLVFGTRPQIIKISLVYNVFKAARLNPILVYTGQHYDPELSTVFFEELRLPKPDYNLGIGSGSQRYQLGEGLQRLLGVLKREQPDRIFTIGDSNPAWIGALGALNTGIKFAHAEAGMRSHDFREPEEHNRISIDSIADYLFCPTEECVYHLGKEHLSGGFALTGDVRYDVWMRYSPFVDDRMRPPGLENENLKGFCLFTIHRQTNAYDPERLRQIVDMLTRTWNAQPIIWPVHPGVEKELHALGLFERLRAKKNLRLLSAVGYLEMLWLERHCSVVVTDSVGVQIEAYLERKPSIILRSKTEFSTLERRGWSKRVEPNELDFNRWDEIVEDLYSHERRFDENLFGDGRAAHRMASILASNEENPGREQPMAGGLLSDIRELSPTP